MVEESIYEGQGLQRDQTGEVLGFVRERLPPSP